MRLFISRQLKKLIHVISDNYVFQSDRPADLHNASVMISRIAKKMPNIIFIIDTDYSDRLEKI